MTSFSEAAAALAARLYSAPTVRPTVGPITNVLPTDEANSEIAPNQAYFTVSVNELYLTTGRQLWATYDPMIVATIEYVYDKKVSAVPVVIGPSMIKGDPGHDVPRGLIVNDIPETGPHPYRGGKIKIAIILYKVKHTDYAHEFLKFTESISKATSVVGDTDTLQKVGSALVNGVNQLLSMRGNEPLAGHVFTIDGNSLSGFRSGYSVLISDPQTDLTKLRVNCGRLEIQNGDGFVPYRSADYALYNVSGRFRRGEIDTLPFRGLLDQSIEAALANDDESWKRSKAYLLSLYGQMATSPDLIPEEAERLMDEFTQKVVTARERAKRLGALSSGGETRTTLSAREHVRQMNSRTNVLALE
jgi:hypothetical protein